MNQEPIVALATAPLKSALAIVRCSGDGIFDIVNKCFSKKIKLINEKNKIFYGYIKNNEEIIDQVILLAYKSPFSFTGEDSVEIICHGSVLIANEIIEVLIKNGCRYAVNGEFSNRAFLNNKINLIEAEAINDVINSVSKESKNLSMLSLIGKSNDLVINIKNKIADIMSLIEVNIDYPEYNDIENVTKEKIEKDISDICENLKQTISNGEKGKIIKDGLKVAIVGKPNAGKSSLLNAFLKQNKAIVTSVAGTTRDVVEGEIILNGIYLKLLDTAGIRESENLIEKEGIKKSKQAIDEADLVIYVVDATDKDEDLDILENIKDKIVVKVYNKSDLVRKDDDKLYISALTNDIDPLKDEIIKKLNLSKENYQNPSINNARELGLLKKCYEYLNLVLDENKNDLSLDLISIDLKNAYNCILEILGEETDLDFTKEIFKRFCVGK